MISSRCPRPMGTSESTALSPICMGSCTDLRTMMPGALISTRAPSASAGFSVDGVAEAVHHAPEQALPTGTSTMAPVGDRDGRRSGRGVRDGSLGATQGRVCLHSHFSLGNVDEKQKRDCSRVRSRLTERAIFFRSDDRGCLMPDRFFERGKGLTSVRFTMSPSLMVVSLPKHTITDVVVLEVEGHALDAGGELDHLAGLNLVQAVDARDAITDGEDASDFVDVEGGVVAGDAPRGGRRVLRGDPRRLRRGRCGTRARS